MWQLHEHNAGTGELSVALAHADATGTSSSCMNGTYTCVYARATLRANCLDSFNRARCMWDYALLLLHRIIFRISSHCHLPFLPSLVDSLLFSHSTCQLLDVFIAPLVCNIHRLLSILLGCLFIIPFSLQPPLPSYFVTLIHALLFTCNSPSSKCLNTF